MHFKFACTQSGWPDGFRSCAFFAMPRSLREIPVVGSAVIDASFPRDPLDREKKKGLNQRLLLLGIPGVHFASAPRLRSTPSRESAQ